MRRIFTREALLLLGSLVATLLHPPPEVRGQRDTPPVGREAALALEFPALRFDPPRPERRELSMGVPVLFLEDRSLPIVDIFVRFEGGYGRFDRSHYAAARSLPSLMRSGGTRTLSPDSVERILDFHSVQLSFGSGGESVTSGLNVLTHHLPAAFELWMDLLRYPGFDREEVELWRRRALESIERRRDDPTWLAYGEFNRLLYGDHPVGWELAAADLEPGDVTREKLQWLHRRIVCAGNLIVGVSGDIAWERAEELLEEALGGWQGCQEELPPTPDPEILREAGVFLIPKEVNQSTVVMAHPSGVRREASPEYFASRIAHLLLGGGSFASRLMSRVRSEAGFAYSVSSTWTTPVRNEGIVGAVTRTGGETTVAATRLILEVMRELRDEPPSEEEVRRLVDEMVNGLVFDFETAATVVSRQMSYLAQGLPEDWLGVFLRGIREVRPESIRAIFREHLHPSEMTILIVGNPALFDAPLETLGRVTVRKEGEVNPWGR